MTSSARLPPFAMCFKDSLIILNEEEGIKIGRTYYSPHGGGYDLVHDGTREGDTRKNG